MSLSVPSVKLTTAKTEYGRNKVMLPPGRGLMDWIKLTASKNIASQRLPFVTPEELVQHNKLDDCWILLRGNVYDVTKYLEYHPGGVPELMRAAGTDANKLFEQYHAWVNYSSMLKNCLVGPFRGNFLKLPRPKDPVFDNNPTLINGSPRNANTLSLDCFSLCALKPNTKTVRIKSLVGDFKTENLIVDATSKVLRLVIRRFDSEAVCVEWEGFNWSDRSFTVTSPFLRCVDVIFQNEKALTDVRILTQKVSRIEEQTFHPFTVQKVTKGTPNTVVFTLKPAAGLYLPVPLGHHLLFRLPSGQVQRPFTPITYQNAVVTGDSLDKLEFFVKFYPEGKLTQELAKVAEGDTIEVSEPIGRKDNARLAEKADQVLMLAAGTGITPMINIMEHRRRSKKSKMVSKLLWFNRTAEDIFEEILKLEDDKDSSVVIDHVLSEPDVNWSGKQGRIRAELLTGLEFDWDKVLVFVCGPEGFNNSAVGLLSELNVASERVVVFQ